MAWFPCYKSGGIKKGNILSSQTAAPGQAGYINFARIKILDNYANHPCYFTIQNRGIYFPIILSIGFQNTNHTDPGLISFLYWGATDYGIYAVKNTTSTWDLYVKKTEVHDEVGILSLNYKTRYFDITFPCGFAVEKGENWMSPQPGGRVAGADHVYDSKNGAIITASYSKAGMTRDGITWLACWDGYEMCAINKNVFTYLKKLDHYGMCIPYEDGAGQNDQEWIRTTNNGIIPYSADGSEGKSSLGTETWPFANCYSKKIVTNQIHASNDFIYNQKYYGHSIIKFDGSTIKFVSSLSDTNGIGIQTNPANDTIRIAPMNSTSARLGDSSHSWVEIYTKRINFVKSYLMDDNSSKLKIYGYEGIDLETKQTKYIKFLTPTVDTANGLQGVQLYCTAGSTSPDFTPVNDIRCMLGTSNHRWSSIYARDSTISTSDRNQKKDISYIGEESEYENTKMSNETLVKFIMALKACIFLRKDGESGRPHHGIIAQDFEKLMEEIGLHDHAAFIKSPKTEEIEITKEDGSKEIKIQEVPGEYIYGIRYEEFIADVIRFCQILKDENSRQQKKIEDLEKRMEILENAVKCS